MEGQPIGITVHAATPSSRVEYSVYFALAAPADFSGLVDREKFGRLCREGCPNYGAKWSCPPYAPGYPAYIEGWERLIIIFMTLELGQLSYIQSDYLKVKAANSILKSRADQFLREMAAKHGQAISTGSCRLCRPCARKRGRPCLHPDKMCFSYEAMGLDVGALVERVFGRELQWYRRGRLPDHTSAVCGLLSNDELTPEYLCGEYGKFFGGEASAAGSLPPQSY